MKSKPMQSIPLILLFAATWFASSVQSATVAYWRFETGPANTDVAHAGADGAFSGTTPDVSGNGNSLSTWSPGGWAGFAYRTNVPFATVTQNRSSNQFSVKNTGSFPAMFTSAAGSSPTGINAQTMTPAQFTIEVSYKAEANAGYRTVVGRDAKSVDPANTNLAALYLQVRPDDSVCISFTDVSGYTHTAFSPPGWIYGFNFGSNPEGTNTPWYNLAAVSDGSTLKLYVNYVLVATNDMTTSGSPNRALAKGSFSGTDWTTGAWSVGRGLYAGGHTDRAYGFIDEVRISNSGLTPAEFLIAPRPRIEIISIAGGNAVLNVTGGQPGATCYLMQSSNAAMPMTSWGTLSVKMFDTNGNSSFTTPFNAGMAKMFYAIKANVSTTPPIGALTYSLASGSETWPADVRTRIIYAMDGAVAQYNRYGTFNKHITVNYNTGVPTAQANYDGWLEFGANASYQQYRTALHETGHTLGMGTTWQWRANLSVASGTGTWIGANGVAQIQTFDGAGGTITSDGTHFWPYGLNYDSEGNTESYRRHVLMMAAFRKDMGIQ
jgi:hypothetical protein